MDSEVIGWIFIISVVAYIAFILIICEIARRKERKRGNKMAKFLLIWMIIEMVFGYIVKIYGGF